MLAELKELWRFRELLWSMVERELRIRYKNSFLGFFWSLLNPLITVLVITVVFKVYLRNGTPNFGAYVLAAYLPYMFLNASILDAAQTISGSTHLIKKVYFPREILPLTAIIANFIHFLLALGVFFLYLLAVYLLNPQESPFQITTLYLPLLLVVNLMLTAGLGLLFSALNTFYEDVKYILSVLLWLMIFLCPVMYFSENVYYPSENALHYTLYHMNPVAMLCMAYRKILLAPQDVVLGETTYPALPMDWALFGYTALFGLFILWMGYSVFNRLKWRFVERP